MAHCPGKHEGRLCQHIALGHQSLLKVSHWGIDVLPVTCGAANGMLPRGQLAAQPLQHLNCQSLECPPTVYRLLCGGIFMQGKGSWETTRRPIIPSLQGLAVKEDVRERLQACIEEAQQEQGH